MYSFLGEIFYLFVILCRAYSFIVIAAGLMTWLNPDPNNPIVRFLRAITEPVLSRIRKHLPFVVFNNIDLSPIVLVIAIQVFIYILAKILF